MNLFNGTKYPESAKSAENDRLHLLMCDNGSLTLSHKESGRVFFEFPTLLVGKNDCYSYCTHAEIQKCRREKGAFFDVTQRINAPVIHENRFFAINEPIIFMNTIIMDDEDDSLTLMCSLSLPKGYSEYGYKTVLRFPTGIDFPAIDSEPYEEKLPQSLSAGANVTLTDDQEQSISLTNASDTPVDVQITKDGNLDVFLPSSIPANEIGLLDFSFVLSF